MRRLLIVVVTLALALGVAASAVASNRIPGNVRRIAVTLTFPGGVDGSRPPVHRTLTRRTTVQRVIRAVDALQAAKQRIMCPMMMVILGPVLTVVFKAGGAGSNPALAQAQVQVRTGTQGDSGSSSCFPIRLTARGVQTPLIGNSFVRLMGGLIGVQIS
ncbi:MAG TPA: hypothetical protein VMV16_01620 [Solirubrobacteraceae bacterium]|nr:hypothetical protein [Solirubrobacteraceae bacterium]